MKVNFNDVGYLHMLNMFNILLKYNQYKIIEVFILFFISSLENLVCT